MDPFIQSMLEKAEQRSRALGICGADATKWPLGEAIPSSLLPANKSTGISSCSGGGGGDCATTMVVESQQQQVQQHKQQLPLHTHKSGIGTNNSKVLRQLSAFDKENVDLNVTEATQHPAGTTQPIRETLTNRMQSLAALYSEKGDIPSPIHRTEGNFNTAGKDITELAAEMRKPKQRFGKLAALASTINQWEDDTIKHKPHYLQTDIAAKSTSAAVIRTSKSTSMSNTGESGSCTNTKPPPPKPDLPSSRGRARPEGHTKAQAPKPPAVSSSKDKNPKTKQLKWDPKVLNSVENNDPKAKTGLVSSIVEMFESLARANTPQKQKPRKDPSELSLKEKIKLFEKNKGVALVPKILGKF